jgi:hypothetical protein
LVHRNSTLVPDILIIQKSMNSKIANEILASKLQELRPKYFRVQNFKQAVINYFSDFENSNSFIFNSYSLANKQRQALMMEKNETSFILDMDAQFMMVPKAWITKLLAIKLVSIHLITYSIDQHKLVIIK